MIDPPLYGFIVDEMRFYYAGTAVLTTDCNFVLRRCVNFMVQMSCFVRMSLKSGRSLKVACGNTFSEIYMQVVPTKIYTSENTGLRN